MKKIIFGCCLLTRVVVSQAQVPYPSAPPVEKNLLRLEYFIDTDPGSGLGKPVLLSPAQHVSSFTFNADITGLSNGFHRIYLRSQNADGTWSLTNTVFFDNYILPLYGTAGPNSTITAAEYFIDTDPGNGNGTAIPITAATDISSKQIVVNITGLAAGTHRLYIRTRDANGRWSLTNTAIFDNTAIPEYPSAPARDPVTGLEYFIDNDPGLGNGTAVTISQQNDLSNFSFSVPVGSLAAGSHTLYVRSRQNPWSLTAYAEFTKTGTLPVTWKYIQGEIKDESALISWATAYEENTSYFEVEYGSNGKDFISIGQVTATGQPTGSRYSFLHAHPSAGTAYYRIRQVDKDGQHKYSRTILLVIQKDLQAPILFPNPAQSNINLLWPSTVKKVSLSLYEVSGRLIKRLSVAPGRNSVSISVKDLTQGIYYVLIEGDGIRKTISFTRQ